MKYIITPFKEDSKEQRGCQYLQTWRVNYWTDHEIPTYNFSELRFVKDSFMGNPLWITAYGIHPPHCVVEKQEEINIFAEQTFKELEHMKFQVNTSPNGKHIYFDLEGYEK